MTSSVLRGSLETSSLLRVILVFFITAVDWRGNVVTAVGEPGDVIQLLLVSAILNEELANL
jgi:hypothetical protein